jgi:photosystem II stability/assembly factor-like uncharacterized protein
MSIATRYLLNAFVLLLLGGLTPSLLAQEPFWERTDGPRGGWVQSVVAMGGGRFFLCLRHGPVFRSTDSGAHWVQVTASATDRLMVLSDGSLLRDDWNNDGHTSGTFRSTDDGETWAELNDAPERPDYYAIDSTGRLVVGTRRTGVWRMASDGRWDSLGLGGAGQATAMLTLPGATIIAAMMYPGKGGSIYRSTDDGDSWELMKEIGQMVTDLIRSSSGALFASVQGTNTPLPLVPGPGVYRSDDNGVTWRGSGLDSLPVMSIAEAADRAIIAGLEYSGWTRARGFARSTDKGKTWVIAPLDSPDVYCYARGSDGVIVAGARPQGGYVSIDGITWKQSGPPAAFVRSLVINRDGHLFAACPTTRAPVCWLLRSTDQGDNWEHLPFHQVVDALAVGTSGDLYAAVDGKGVFQSLDSGMTWRTSGPQVVSARDTSLDFTSVVVSPDTAVYATTQSGKASRTALFRSIDAGATWKVVELPQEVTVIDAFTVSPRSELFLASDELLFRSTDRGETWGFEQWSQQLDHIRNIAFDSSGGLYAAATGIYRKVNDDSTGIWQQIAPHVVTSLAINRYGDVFASGTATLRSTDGGVNWDSIGSGLVGNRVQAVVLDRGGMLFGASSGVFRSRNTTASVAYQLVSRSTENTFRINPNPVSDRLHLNVLLKQLCAPLISLYRYDGAEIATFKTDVYEKGDHTLELNVGLLPSGTYRCVMYCGDEVTSAPVVIVR